MPIRLVLVRLAADSREPINELIEPHARFRLRAWPPPVTIIGESE
jgi:hypothetical protein